MPKIIENPEKFIRINSRISKKHDKFIKSQKEKTGKSEGEILRELLDKVIK